ncbi:Radical SAM domain protein [Methanosalsum zhilinae DSM 4017]|uniref:Radical SAM domain protein n=2 Tax=Methanosalsum zhilinae TaxID=39669 RepID=F7XLV5_METZD|nr:Radical SAM domain protein [Methanosalsum zhilinae DSM 4017]
MDYDDLDRFFEMIVNGHELSDKEIKSLLSMDQPEDIEKLYYLSRNIRNHFFSNKVFLYSFVYYSTYCKNRCSFCYYNSINDINRYRLSIEDIINISRQLKDEGVHMVDLTMGEDPYFHSDPSKLVDLVKLVKNEIQLPIMISPGVIDKNTLNALRINGANFYALYQETYDSGLYKDLRVGQSYQDRIDTRNYARKIGYCIEDGILTGIEDNLDSTIISLKGLKKSDPDMVRAMTFVPQPGTPFENQIQNSSQMELKIIAILRLMFPDRLIPASLDLEGIEGMISRLNAGANVVTSIIPSDSTLEGVVNYDRDFEIRKRDAVSVIKKIREMGMVPAEQSDFNKILGL